MATNLEEVKAKLDQLEKAEVEYKDLCKQYRELEASLEKGKEVLGKLAKSYNEVVGPYTLSLLEAEELHTKIKNLATVLGEKEYPGNYGTRYGYSGNLGQYNNGLVIHEDVAAATHGDQVWPHLVEARKKRGGK